MKYTGDLTEINCLLTANFEPLYLNTSLTYLHHAMHLQSGCRTRLQRLTIHTGCTSGFAKRKANKLTSHIFVTFSMLCCVIFAYTVLNFGIREAVARSCCSDILWLVSDGPYPCICRRHRFNISPSIFGFTLKEENIAQPWQKKASPHFCEMPGMHSLAGDALEVEASPSLWAGSSALCWKRHGPPSSLTFMSWELGQWGLDRSWRKLNINKHLHDSWSLQSAEQILIV